MSETPHLHEHAEEVYAAMNDLLEQIWQEDWAYPDVPAVRRALAVQAKVQGRGEIDVKKELRAAAYVPPPDTRTPEERAEMDRAMRVIVQDVGRAYSTSNDDAIAALFEKPHVF